ncbi:heavy metal-binding domain-containing protein [Pedobacter sp. UYEF25]
MNYIKILPIALAITFCMAACSNSAKKQIPTAQANQKKKVQYTCRMDTGFTSDKPGKCPKCGMTLIVKK